jgi:hypothetical protein
MTVLFGNQWTSTHGEEVDETRVWQASLKEVSEIQIRKALDILVNQNPEWPPKPAAFREMCLYGNDSREQAAFDAMANRITDKSKLLPKLKATKETALNHIKNMRKGLTD